MDKTRKRLGLGLIGVLIGATLGMVVLNGRAQTPQVPATSQKMQKVAMKTGKEKPIEKIKKSDAEWRKQLSPLAYDVLRHEGTEPAFQNAYWNNHQNGTYVCAGCDLPLFTSQEKFESGTGWPSFWQPIKANHVQEKVDNSFGMQRIALECARCDGHLGHVFDDGPQPTGLRYCMNSAAMKFIPKKK